MPKRKIEVSENSKKVTRRNGTTIENSVTRTQPSKVAKKMGMKLKEPSIIPTELTTVTRKKTKPSGKTIKNIYQRLDFSSQMKDKMWREHGADFMEKNFIEKKKPKK